MYILITSPLEFDSARTKTLIQEQLDKGLKTYEIFWKTDFFAPEWVITEGARKFQIAKNQLAFHRDLKLKLPSKL